MMKDKWYNSEPPIRLKENSSPINLVDKI
jgi:hypothetical protein